MFNKTLVHMGKASASNLSSIQQQTNSFQSLPKLPQTKSQVYF
jgi:hypothetical protein